MVLVELDENDGVVMIGLERLIHATERLRAYVLGAARRMLRMLRKAYSSEKDPILRRRALVWACVSE